MIGSELIDKIRELKPSSGKEMSLLITAKRLS